MLKIPFLLLALLPTVFKNSLFLPVLQFYRLNILKMESDSPKEIDVNKKITEALKVSLGKFFESLDDEETESCDGGMSTEGDDETEPFDGVFYTDGDDEPLVVDPKTTTMGDLERLMDEADDKHLLVDELLDWVSTRTKGDVDLAATLMKKGARRLDNKSKQKDPCRIIVKGDGIFVFARHGHNLTGESPERGLIAASAQPKTRCQWRHWV